MKLYAKYAFFAGDYDPDRWEVVDVKTTPYTEEEADGYAIVEFEEGHLEEAYDAFIEREMKAEEEARLPMRYKWRYDGDFYEDYIAFYKDGTERIFGYVSALPDPHDGDYFWRCMDQTGYVQKKSEAKENVEKLVKKYL